MSRPSMREQLRNHAVRHNGYIYCQPEKAVGYPCPQVKEPGDIEAYQVWLDGIKQWAEKRELELEEKVFGARVPNLSILPRDHRAKDAECDVLWSFVDDAFCLVNLQREVISVNPGCNYSMREPLPTQTYWDEVVQLAPAHLYQKFTVDRNACPDEYLGNLDVPLPQRQKGGVKYPGKIVRARSKLRGTSQVYSMHLLGQFYLKYVRTMFEFGREWTPESAPLREMVYAYLCIASGQCQVWRHPSGICFEKTCPSNSGGRAIGLISTECAGEDKPWTAFGSRFHLPGEPAGIAPAESTYWFENVLVKIVLVADGAAIEAAADWGLAQGRTNFMMVVISLYEVAFAELTTSAMEEKHSIRYTVPVQLAPMRAEHGLSVHPVERIEMQAEAIPVAFNHSAVYEDPQSDDPDSKPNTLCPGLLTLVAFLGTALERRAATSSKGRLPPELYGHIVSFASHRTVKACFDASTYLRVPQFPLHEQAVLNDMEMLVGGTVLNPTSRYPWRVYLVDDRSHDVTPEEAIELSQNPPKRWLVLGTGRKALTTIEAGYLRLIAAGASVAAEARGPM